MDKGFGLIGLLLALAIIAMIAFGNFYYSDTLKQEVRDNGGVNGMLDSAEGAKNEIEKENAVIINQLEQK